MLQAQETQLNQEFLLACQQGDQEKVSATLAQGANINCHSTAYVNFGETAVIIAIKKNYSELLEQLFAASDVAGIPLNLLAQDGLERNHYSALHWAAILNYAKLASQLLNRCPELANVCSTIDAKTALELAVEHSAFDTWQIIQNCLASSKSLIVSPKIQALQLSSPTNHQYQDVTFHQPTLRLFYRTLYIRLEEIFIAYKAIASGLVAAQSSYTGTAAFGAVSLLGLIVGIVPYATGAADIATTVLAYGVNAADIYRQSNFARTISSLMTMGEATAVIEQVAKCLTIKFANQILLLEDEPEETLSLPKKILNTLTSVYNYTLETITRIAPMKPAAKFAEYFALNIVDAINAGYIVSTNDIASCLVAAATPKSLLTLTTDALSNLLSYIEINTIKFGKKTLNYLLDLSNIEMLETMIAKPIRQRIFSNLENYQRLIGNPHQQTNYFTKPQIETGAPQELHYLVNNNTSKLVRGSFSKASLSWKNSRNLSLIHIIAIYNRYYLIRLVVRLGLKLDIRDSAGNTALHLAARFASFDSLVLLMQAGANINAINENEENFLHILVKSNYFNIFYQIITMFKQQCQPLLSAADASGRQLIHYAASNRDIRFLEFLIACKVDIDATDISKNTPLMESARSGLAEHIFLLKHHHAEFDERNTHGQSPRDVIVHSFSDTLQETLLAPINLTENSQALIEFIPNIKSNIDTLAISACGFQYSLLIGSLTALSAQFQLTYVNCVYAIGSSAIPALLLALGFGPSEMFNLINHELNLESPSIWQRATFGNPKINLLINELIANIKFATNNSNLTFGQLHELIREQEEHGHLHTQNYHFRDLSLSAYNIATGQIVALNHQTTPEMKLVDALQICLTTSDSSGFKYVSHGKNQYLASAALFTHLPVIPSQQQSSCLLIECENPEELILLQQLGSTKAKKYPDIPQNLLQDIQKQSVMKVASRLFLFCHETYDKTPYANNQYLITLSESICNNALTDPRFTNLKPTTKKTVYTDKKLTHLFTNLSQYQQADNTLRLTYPMETWSTVKILLLKLQKYTDNWRLRAYQDNNQVIIYLTLESQFIKQIAKWLANHKSPAKNDNPLSLQPSVMPIILAKETLVFATPEHALIQAARNSKLHKLREYIKSYRYTKTLYDSDFRNLVHLSVLTQAHDQVQFILTELIKYFDLEEYDIAGNTPMHLAAEINADKILKLLIEFGASVKSVNLYGNTPLHLAVKAGALAAVEFLLAQGADPKKINSSGDDCFNLVSNSQSMWTHVPKETQERIIGKLAIAESMPTLSNASYKN